MNERPYNVHYIRPDTGKPSMGIVHPFYKDMAGKQEKAIEKRGNYVVDDAIDLGCFEMKPSQVKSASFDEAILFVEAQYKKALKANPKTFGVGSLFHLPVADGKAFYVVTAVGCKKCRVEWRGFGGGDRYTDHWLGWGGDFPISKIKDYVDRNLALQKLFGSTPIAKRLSRKGKRS